MFAGALPAPPPHRPRGRPRKRPETEPPKPLPVAPRKPVALSRLRPATHSEPDLDEEALLALAEETDESPESPWDPEDEDRARPPKPDMDEGAPVQDEPEDDGPGEVQAARLTMNERIRERREQQRIHSAYFEVDRGPEESSEDDESDDEALETPTIDAPPPRPRRRLPLAERYQRPGRFAAADWDALAEVQDDADLFRGPRPKTRGDCVGGERPCPWVACKHHLYLDVLKGQVVINIPIDGDLPEESCALDVADKGGVTLEEIGASMLLTRERVRQIEAKALRKLARAIERGNLTDLADLDPP